MGKFDGKCLLELGSSVASVDIVKYAKSEGAYVIVADYLPIEKSEAKQFADETVMISTLDVNALAKLVTEKNVDGIFCGVSEINLKSVQAVSSMTGLPCYFNMEQWELCENKQKFKELCKKNNVPVAKQFFLSNPPTIEELERIDYPVIVKPVDLSASKGIHICHDENELSLGYKDALEQSPSHSVIVEQYLDGDEISATYTFVDGNCRLSLLSQMYYNKEQKGMIPLPDAYIYPSNHINAFLEQVDTPIKNMLKSIGLKNGSVFITGIASKNDFAFFEAGLRLAGTAPYKFVNSINKINIMELMTEYAINGKVSEPYLIRREDPMMKGKICCLFSLLNSGGRIARITGVEKASRLPGVIAYRVQRKEGDIVIKDGTLGQINVRFYIVKDTMEEIRETIKVIQKLVEVKDDFGNNMLLHSDLLNVL